MSPAANARLRADRRWNGCDRRWHRRHSHRLPHRLADCDQLKLAAARNSWSRSRSGTSSMPSPAELTGHFRPFVEEMAGRGVHVEVRVVNASDTDWHDRFILAMNGSWKRTAHEHGDEEGQVQRDHPRPTRGRRLTSGGRSSIDTWGWPPGYKRHERSLGPTSRCLQSRSRQPQQRAPRSLRRRRSRARAS